MSTGRILMFRPSARTHVAPPESPFRHLMPAPPLTPRQVQHRQRMLGAVIRAASVPACGRSRVIDWNARGRL